MRFNLKKLFIAVSLAAVVFAVPSILRTLYYAQYNAVVSRLEAVPGLTIISSWQHEDVTLEDCGFTVEADGASARFDFWDNQDWRSLFYSVDGIRFTHGNARRFVSRAELRDAGIPVRGLTDLLHHLPEVHGYCMNRANTEPTLQDYRNRIADRTRWITMRTLSQEGR